MMEKVDLPEMEKGEWKVEKFTTLLRRAPVGETFTRLRRNGTLVMTDTPAEMSDHSSAVRRAKGSCLISGLGIGMVLKNILLKPEVTDVTVVEISQDLIDLIAPYYQDERVTFVCADILTWKPPKGKRYNMVWHDIWDTICTDNLPEMATLHRRYGRKTDWQGSWCKKECEYNRRRFY